MILYQNITVQGLNIFYREAGNYQKPVLLLLHGFPTSSHMFRNLMPLLTEQFYLIAPDYPGFGQSDAPDNNNFEYSFAHLSQIITEFLKLLDIHQYYMYVFDYGAPIGFRLALEAPENILGIISQNGNIYEVGLGTKWQQRKAYWQDPTPEKRQSLQSAFASKTIIAQYQTGEAPNSVSPDGYTLDIHYTQDQGYSERQSDLIFDYRTNVDLYPQFQNYLQAYQPPLLAVWGKNDPSFIPAGALAFKLDDPNSEDHLLNAGHFALETHYQEIAQFILKFFNC